MAKCPHDHVTMTVPKCYHSHSLGDFTPLTLTRGVFVSSTIKGIVIPMWPDHLDLSQEGRRGSCESPWKVDLLRASRYLRAVNKIQPLRSRGTKREAMITEPVAPLTPGSLLSLLHLHIQGQGEGGMDEGFRSWLRWADRCLLP